MGDLRFGRHYVALQEAADPTALLQSLPDEDVIAALAAASREKEPYLANVLATEAMNRALRWQALFSSLGEGVVVLGPEGDVVTLNPAAETLLGWRVAEARGEPWDRILGVAAPATPGQPPFRNGADAGLPRRSEEETFQRRDGTAFLVAYVAAPILREGDVRGMVLVFRDVTGQRERERRRREADQALVALAKDPLLQTGGLKAALGVIARTSARVLGVSRVSVWTFDARHARIRCIHTEDGAGMGHGVGEELAAADCPQYFAALETERTLAVQDACRDPRTRELEACYMSPLGVASTLDVPFRVEGRMEGIVCHEHQGPLRRWSPDEEGFAATIADMVSLAIVSDRRRQAESALQEERRRLQEVVQSVNSVLFALDNEGTITLSEGKGLDALGLRPGELVGKSVLALYGHNPSSVEHIRRALAGERFTSANEEAGRVFETHWSALRDATGAQTGVVGVATDVTEQARARRTLQASERRYASLVETLGAVVWEWDPGTSRFTYVSRHVTDVLGFTPEEWIADPDAWVRHIHPEDRERVLAYRAERVAQCLAHDIEYRIVAADGRTVWVRDLVTVLAEGGRPVKALGVTIDLTARRTAEAERAARRDELRERLEARLRDLRVANEELEAFSRSVAHDLRGHLRGIDALSEALLEDEGPRLGEESRHSLERLRDEAQRMGKLVECIRGFSLAHGGDLRRERVDLSAMAREVARRLRAGEPGRRVQVVIEPDVHATGDPRLLAIVLENLLENAWKYTSRKRDARIEVGTRRGLGGETVYVVRDNGAGFDMGDAPLLFRPFQRLHAEAEFAGTGIGLATVRRIVERHGGRVWAEGERGRGATFSFVLPQERRPGPPRRAGLQGKGTLPAP